MSSSYAVMLEGFGVAFGERIVLSEVTLRFPREGLTVLVGPSGSGKSTLLRTLSGLNDAQPALRTWGRCELTHEAREGERPALVMQHARMLTASVRENLVCGLPERHRLQRHEQDREARAMLTTLGLEELCDALDDDVVTLSTMAQRALAIARALSARPFMLMVDEPTVGLSEREAERIIALLRDQAQRRCVVFVTHQQRHARLAGGRVALLAGGRVLSEGPTERFFASPSSPHGADFVRLGTCRVASPMATPEDLADDVPRPRTLPPAATACRPRSGPRGFHWLVPGRLGGLPRPGIIHDLARDLDDLAELGITVLVSLEEAQTIDPGLLQKRGILPHHVATKDMSVPSVREAAALCRQIATWLGQGQVVALHCKAGLGRTGTLLACFLIFEGEHPVRAIERVRQIQPAWIQSQEQIAFLTTFSRDESSMHEYAHAALRGR